MACWRSSLPCSPLFEDHYLRTYSSGRGLSDCLRSISFARTFFGGFFGTLWAGEFRLNCRGVCDAVISCSGPPQTSPVTTRRFRLINSSYFLVYFHFGGSNLSGKHSHLLPGYFGILRAVGEAGPKPFSELGSFPGCYLLVFRLG